MWSQHGKIVNLIWGTVKASYLDIKQKSIVWHWLVPFGCKPSAMAAGSDDVAMPSDDEGFTPAQLMGIGVTRQRIQIVLYMLTVSTDHHVKTMMNQGFVSLDPIVGDLV